MKNICIITITRGSNFGNRLQNFALQEILKELGYQVDTVRNLTGENLFFIKFPYLYHLFELAVSNRIVSSFLKRWSRNGKIEKKIKFILFNKKYINWSQYSISSRYIPEAFGRSYTAFVCGSDQIWNPGMKFHSDINYLTFVKFSRKLSYAASFGIDSLSKTQLNHLRICLQDFNGISVRENRGLKILRQANIENGTLVLDPTLLLSANIWEQFEQKPAFLLKEGTYILYYNLKIHTDEIDNFVHKLSETNQWEIVDIMDQKNHSYYGIDPFEFIYLVHHAAYICTDSFHATAFSLLYHKNFVVFDRKNMNSRIDTLLEIANMTDRKFPNLKKINIEISRYDYFERNLYEKRKDSINFLKKSLA